MGFENIQKGDRVCIYMQMIPELAVAVLACARIGAIHSVVFGAFAPDSLEARINDSECKLLITQDTGVRGTKDDIPMKSNADIAVQKTPSIDNILVVKRTGSSVEMEEDLLFPIQTAWTHKCFGTYCSARLCEEDCEDWHYLCTHCDRHR